MIDPRTGHFIVADEYGPSVYEFGRNGKLLRVFETPANLVPKVGAVVDYVADRDGGSPTRAGRTTAASRGWPSRPDGKRLYAVLQDPLINEPAPEQRP